MENLFLKNNAETKILLSEQFKTEESFEKLIFHSPELLGGDIFLLKRQLRGGNKTGIPDIIGIDSNGNVCIIEMKNTTVDESIIPQVLSYAIWAEQNPDSIKALWLESKDKPDDLSIDWDDYLIRIIVIAPSILKSTLGFVTKIDYDVNLIEVKMWKDGQNQILYVHFLEEEEPMKRKPVRGLETYDEEFYLSNYNKESARSFLDYVTEIESFIKSKGWPLELKFNKYYAGFKAGRLNVFGVEWGGTKKIQIFVKIPRDQSRDLPIKMSDYNDTWKQAVFVLEPGKTKIQDYYPVFEYAFKKFTGK
ncbi:MAG: hypothetical protein BWY93_00138 [Euryarchaeota archaeon ADurb.BinA087]|nr:MAG: hypothetical protein BWY93_00138 [Euryarchaeota archaeon ADurb.BinA087]